MKAVKARLTKFSDGIVAVDTEYVRPQMDAAHVVMHADRAVIIDTGPNSAVPLILSALGQLGVAPEHVDHVLLTHVHLDHAGGAGQLMQALPRATLLVHPRGAKHIVDPSALIEGTRAVYGDELYSRLYGEIIGVAAERVRPTNDGDRVILADRAFECVFTPGHAMHHQAIVDHGTRGIFTGDTFGVSYREFDTADGAAWIMPTTTPTQFDPEQLKASVRRLMQFAPRRLYLTHYSEVRDCERLAADMLSSIDAFARIAREHAAAPDALTKIREGLRAHAHQGLRAHGCQKSPEEIDAILGKDFELNAAGLLSWLRRKTN